MMKQRTELEGICSEPGIRALLGGWIRNNHSIAMWMQTLVVTGILCIQDPNLAKCRMGYVIMYHGCPILWASRLQSACTLNTMEFNNVSCSAALLYVIPVMDLLKEMKDRVYNVEGNLYMKCKLFEDNSGVFEQAQTAKSRPNVIKFCQPIFRW
jgi:hypothetical protein